MTDNNGERIYADRVQLAYARTLDIVAHAVMLVLGIGFLLYILQLLPLTVPIETVAGNWHLSSSELQAKIHPFCGWSCFASLPVLLHGDAVSYASVVMLSMATIICLVTAVAVFFSEKNHLFLMIAVLQVVVLLVAASGVITSGH
jgi:uncharacterized membrane protein